MSRQAAFDQSSQRECLMAESKSGFSVIYLPEKGAGTGLQLRQMERLMYLYGILAGLFVSYKLMCLFFRILFLLHKSSMPSACRMLVPFNIAQLLEEPVLWCGAIYLPGDLI